MVSNVVNTKVQSPLMPDIDINMKFNMAAINCHKPEVLDIGVATLQN